MFLRKQDMTFHANCLHEMSNPIFWEKNKKNIINLSSAENAQRVVKVKTPGFTTDGSSKLVRNHNYLENNY